MSWFFISYAASFLLICKLTWISNPDICFSLQLCVSTIFRHKFCAVCKLLQRKGSLSRSVNRRRIVRRFHTISSKQHLKSNCYKAKLWLINKMYSYTRRKRHEILVLVKTQGCECDGLKRIIVPGVLFEWLVFIGSGVQLLNEGDVISSSKFSRFTYSGQRLDAVRAVVYSMIFQVFRNNKQSRCNYRSLLKDWGNWIAKEMWCPHQALQRWSRTVSRVLVWKTVQCSCYQKGEQLLWLLNSLEIVYNGYRHILNKMTITQIQSP